MKNVAIKFPSNGGLFAAGPYRADELYNVPEDVAQHLLLRGAESAKPSADPKKPDKIGVIGVAHLQHFEVVRAFEANAKAETAKSAETKSPSAETAAPTEKAAS